MKRPYEYNLTWKWSGDCLSLDIRGFRTGEDGKRQNFLNREVYDGKDPAPAVVVERVMYKAFGSGTIRSESPLGSIEKITMVLKGDQAKE